MKCSDCGREFASRYDAACVAGEVGSRLSVMCPYTLACLTGHRNAAGEWVQCMAAKGGRKMVAR